MTSAHSLRHLLTEQGIILHQAPVKFNWIAQDALSHKVYMYKSRPIIDGFEYMAVGGGCEQLTVLNQLALDWETPLDLSIYRKESDMTAVANLTQNDAPKGQGRPIVGLVVQDLMERALEGTKKYGEPLKAFNSRSAPVDALQEVYDLAMYLRQDVEERAVMASELLNIAKHIYDKFPEYAAQLCKLAAMLNPLAETSECPNAS